MKTKLKRAVKAVAWFAAGMDRWIVATNVADTRKIVPSAQDCMVVPAAEYERLTKVDKLAGKLMQHANCLLKRNKCTEYEPIVLKLMELASEPTARKP